METLQPDSGILDVLINRGAGDEKLVCQETDANWILVQKQIQNDYPNPFPGFVKLFLGTCSADISGEVGAFDCFPHDFAAFTARSLKLQTSFLDDCANLRHVIANRPFCEVDLISDLLIGERTLLV